MADWTHLSLTADARKTLESELAASQGDYRKTMQAIDDYVGDLVSDLFDPDDPEHSLAFTDPDAIADAARDIVSLAQEAADGRYMVQRSAWQEAAGADFPAFAGADREEWTRVMWDVQHGFSNTDYNGLTYGQVMAGRARSGVTIMDLLPEAVSNNPDDLQQAYADFFRQLAVHAAQRQQMADIAADPTHPRWARVPRGRVTCAFCTMLAGRGFVYTSEEAAGGGLGNVYHAHCDCEPVPSWGEAQLAGYDPERLDALYKDAARGLPDGASYRDVLSRMRSQGGVADSPATQAGSGGGKPPRNGRRGKRFGDDWDGEVIRPSAGQLKELGRRVSGKHTAKQKSAALRTWTGSGFESLQRKLYRGDGLDAGERKLATMLDEALTDHVTSETFTVDRYGDPRVFGVDNPHGIDNLRNGRVTDANAGYFATSLDEGGHGVGVRPGEGVRMRILVPPGTHCAYLQDFTLVDTEHEILLPRGVKLRIIDHGIDKDYERWVRAVLVSDGQS